MRKNVSQGLSPNKVFFIGPGGVTQVKTYVNMRVWQDFKWTHISEVHDRRITPFSEPFPLGCTLNSEVRP